MAVIYEQRNTQIAEFADGAQGWRVAGNISLTHDGSRAVFARASSGDSAAFVYPFPATFGAGFVETAVPSDFRLVADIAVDMSADAATNEYIGISLRSANFAQWIFIVPGGPTVRSYREDGLGNGSLIEVTALPASASLRWDIEVHWTGALVAARIRPYEDKGDPSAWTTINTASSSLPTAPEWAGIGMAGTVNVHAPQLYVYSFRLDFPSSPARHWYALADVNAARESIEDLLERKNRATAIAHWSRDDYFVVDSPGSVLESTPLRDLEGDYDTHELARYRAALEAVTGLELAYAWFGTPRCAVTGEKLYTELGPTIVTASDVSGRFGPRCFSFSATNDHGFAAFDADVAEVPDDESVLMVAVVSPTVVPVANTPLFGKQDLFQVAPTPRNGWQVVMRPADMLFELSDTAGGVLSATVAKTYGAGTFFCVVTRIDRTTGLAEIAHESAVSATVNTTGLSYLCPARPLRIGDSRINRPETAPNARIHFLAFAYGQQVEGLTLTTLATNILAAATS